MSAFYTSLDTVKQKCTIRQKVLNRLVYKKQDVVLSRALNRFKSKFDQFYENVIVH